MSTEARNLPGHGVGFGRESLVEQFDVFGNAAQSRQHADTADITSVNDHITGIEQCGNPRIELAVGVGQQTDPGQPGQVTPVPPRP